MCVCVCVCNKVLLKYKREKASDIDTSRGQTKSAPLLVFSWMLQSYQQAAN